MPPLQMVIRGTFPGGGTLQWQISHSSHRSSPTDQAAPRQNPHQMSAPLVKPPPYASYSITGQVALVTGERIEPIFSPCEQGSAAAGTGRHRHRLRMISS